MRNSARTTLAAFAAVITPTQDMITWGYLFVPLFALYLVGVGVCRLVEPGHERCVGYLAGVLLRAVEVTELLGRMDELEAELRERSTA